MKMEFSAGGIIYKEKQGKILFCLILDSYGMWTFPKGHIEKKEKPQEAAVREVAEEVGLENLEVVTLLEKTDYWFKLEEETIHKFVYFFLMKAQPEDELQPQLSEIKDARWFSPKEMIENLAYKKDSQSLIKKAFKILNINLEETNA